MNEYMKQAIALAKEAAKRGDIPVGAVRVRNGEVIATGSNRREELKSALGHAEIEAIHNACQKLGTWRLSDCEIYVTLEPCPMCAGAIINSRIKKVVFGAFDKNGGACDSVCNLLSMPFSAKPEVWAGIMEEECKELLGDFFKSVRD